MNPEKLQMLAWLVPLLPIAGFVINIFIGRRLPKALVSLLACGTVLASAVISWMLFLHVRGSGAALVSKTTEWFLVPGVAGGELLKVLVEHKLVVDQLTCVMILVVTNVGFLIHLYSTGYMADDKRYSRYFAYLNLFTGFMLLLVMASNLLLMFVGWEGVGLCSYLLISFWFEKLENAKAGMKAFVTNRVGDFGFTIGLLLLFVYLGTAFNVWTVDFGQIKDTLEAHKGATGLSAVATVVGILLFVGATGKSAQIPLYTWLPDAMAGPTPVSALIHAATMVTAGVYMVARMNFLYALAPWAMTVVAVTGAATALFAGTIALAQYDIKKVLAYSTVSQLGFMFMGVGVGAFAAGIFHLMTHAFFKACLFLGSGSVIHGMGGEQDIRKMGGLKKYMPITFVTFVVASLAIAGFPLLAGFWSKDEILWKTFSTQALVLPGWILWGMGAIAAAFTAFYMTRLCVMTFWGELRSEPKAHHGGHDAHAHADHDAHGGHDEHDSSPAASAKGEKHANVPHESPWTMTVPLVVLMLLSIVGGFIGMPPSFPGGGVFEHWLSPVCPEAEVAPSAAEGPRHASAGAALIAAQHEPAQHKPAGHGEQAPSHSTEYLLMGVSVAIALAGIGAGWVVYKKRNGEPAKAFTERHRALHELVRDKYRVDELYAGAVIEPLLDTNELLARFDNAVIDGAVNGTASGGAAMANNTGYFDNEVVDGGVNATGYATQAAGQGVRRLQTGNIRGYLTAAIVGALVVIGTYCVFLRWNDIREILW